MLCRINDLDFIGEIYFTAWRVSTGDVLEVSIISLLLGSFICNLYLVVQEAKYFESYILWLTPEEDLVGLC